MSFYVKSKLAAVGLVLATGLLAWTISLLLEQRDWFYPSWLVSYVGAASVLLLAGKVRIGT